MESDTARHKSIILSLLYLYSSNIFIEIFASSAPSINPPSAARSRFNDLPDIGDSCSSSGASVVMSFPGKLSPSTDRACLLLRDLLPVLTARLPLSRSACSLRGDGKSINCTCRNTVHIISAAGAINVCADIRSEIYHVLAPECLGRVSRALSALSVSHYATAVIKRSCRPPSGYCRLHQMRGGNL